MRKAIVLAIVLALSGTGIAAYGQTRADAVKEARKERKATDREAEKALNERSVKAARKEARRLKKEGWSVSPGALPLEKQLDRAYTMQYEYDTDNYPKYIMADAQSVGQNYDAAKMQAMELGGQQAAGLGRGGIGGEDAGGRKECHHAEDRAYPAGDGVLPQPAERQ